MDRKSEGRVYEIHHIREGKHGARSTQQAIAIALSKARRAGVKLGAPPKGRARAKTRQSAAYATRAARRRRKPARTRSWAMRGALKRERRGAATRTALARQARQAARRRGSARRRAAARKAVATKGHARRSAAARKQRHARRRKVPHAPAKNTDKTSSFYASRRFFSTADRGETAMATSRARSKRGSRARRKSWVRHVAETSDAMDLPARIFKRSPRAVARGLKKSVERSSRTKGRTKFASAMSMLNLYINRSGRSLPNSDRHRLERAKVELRRLFGRPAAPNARRG